MVNVAIHEKYFQTLVAFGDLQTTVEKAIQRYVIETISEKIAELQHQLLAYQEQYGMDYPEFERRIAEDEDFVTHIENTVKKTWELDAAHWEFCAKGVDDWTRKLASILRI